VFDGERGDVGREVDGGEKETERFENVACLQRKMSRLKEESVRWAFARWRIYWMLDARLDKVD
jgi:hypothetical protein